jgi:hypothetical protein
LAQYSLSFNEKEKTNRVSINVNITMAGTMNRKNNQVIWKRIAKEITDKKNIGSVNKINQKSILNLSGIIRSKMDNIQTN